jgi:exodeoxyribonuclease VII large subunit
VHPRERLRTSRQLLEQLAARLSFAASHRVDAWVAQLAQLKSALGSLNPSAVLERGYSLTRNARGEVVVDAARVGEGEVLTTMLSKGWIESEVKKKGR